MAFDDLPPQPPIYPPEAEAFARKALALSREAATQCDTTFDVPYGQDYWQRIDIYRPMTQASDRMPVLLFAHGGAWTHGYKEWAGMVAPAVTSFPAIFVSVSYRLAPENRYPKPFDDAVAALAWVYRNIARFGGDPERIHVGGHSAGGHLYALATLRGDALRSAELPDNVIKGCFPVSAQLNLVFADPQPGSGEARIYSMFLETPSDAEQASPLHQVHRHRNIPFLLAYGTKDFPRIIRANEQMLAAMKQANARVECHVFDGYDHFDTALELRNRANPWVRIVHARMCGARAS